MNALLSAQMCCPLLWSPVNLWDQMIEVAQPYTHAFVCLLLPNSHFDRTPYLPCATQDSAVEITVMIPEDLPKGIYTVQLCETKDPAVDSISCSKENLLTNLTDVQVLEAASDVVSVVELDKPIYKGGQSVQIRAICFNRDFLPCKNAEFQIEVVNPSGHKIFKHKGPGEDIGVLTTEMDIIEGSSVGDYKVAMVASGDGGLRS